MSRYVLGFTRLLLSTAALATPPAPYESYVELETSDVNTGDNSMQNGAHWSDKAVPDGTKDYYVPNGKTIYTAASTYDSYFEFPGRTLACAGFLSNACGNKGFGVKVLHLLPGFDFQVQNNCPNIGGGASAQSNYGTWTVKGTEETPAKISILWAYNGTAITFYPKLVGDEDAFLTIYRKGNPYPPSAYEPPDGAIYKAGQSGGYNVKYYTPDKMYNEMKGSLEEYFGTIQVVSNATIQLTTATGSMPGTIRVENGGHLRQAMTSGAYTIANLDLRENATVYFEPGKTVGTYTITNSLVREADKPFIVSFEDLNGAKDISAALINGKLKLKLFTLTGPAAANAPDFSDVKIDATFNVPVNPSLVVKDEGDDKVVYLSNETDEENVYMINACGSSAALSSAFYPTNGVYWSTGTIPSPDTVKVITALQTIQFFGYQSASQTSFDFPDTVFYAAAGIGTYCQAMGMTFKEYHFLGGGTLYTYGGGTADAPFLKHLKLDSPGYSKSFSMKDIKGPIYSEGASDAINTINSFQQYGFRFKDDFRGTNTVLFTNIKNHNNTFSYIALEGNSTNFVGEMRFNTYTIAPGGDKHVCPDEPTFRYLSVMLNHGGNFGGPYHGAAANAWRSIYANGHTVFLATNDMAVTETSRTFFLDDCVRFYVASNKTFAIVSDITLKGEFRKTGAGCLALGGAMRFNDANDTDPMAGNNVLNVTNGTLRVDGVDAVNGAAITFAEGTKLAIDPESPAALSATGFKATRWATPLTSLAADGRIRVALAPKTAAALGAGGTLALCTVPTAAAADIAFSVVKYPKYSAKVRAVENNDETTTYFVDYVRNGAMMLIR